MSLMELKGIHVVFEKAGGLLGEDRHIHVLKNLDLELQQGEILALVGESGCGKTTTGKVITGLLQPTSGQVFWRGDRSIPNGGAVSKTIHPYSSCSRTAMRP